jgi:hypothetical protein
MSYQSVAEYQHSSQVEQLRKGFSGRARFFQVSEGSTAQDCVKLGLSEAMRHDVPMNEINVALEPLLHSILDRLHVKKAERFLECSDIS